MGALGGKLMEWNYEGDRGPDKWKNICSAFYQAETGSLQSPIALNDDPQLLSISQDLLTFNYSKTVFETSFFNHTVHLSPKTKEKTNIIEFNHKKYFLEDLHFHFPSEHEINQKSFPLEFHLVHRSVHNELLVVGVTVLPSERPINTTLAALDDKALNAGGGLSVPIDLDRLLPENKQFYHYTGSLTTPPTSGPVEWIVFRQQSFMRQGLLQAFKKNIGKTNRPLQPIKNRPIYLSIDE